MSGTEGKRTQIRQPGDGGGAPVRVAETSASSLAPSPVQLRQASEAAAGANAAVGHDFSGIPVHAAGHSVFEIAERGASGAAGALPHLAEIQRAFGRHDVRQVQASQDSRAAAAARAIGARAYATGERVVFASSPDLRTAAHEAAHIVQQRAGVELAQGVGKAGDRYERNADAVAERVLTGASAESLLDEVAPGSESSAARRRAVQRIATDFGDFKTSKYDKLGPAGKEWGVDIVLEFDPDKTKVNAEKIGLTQSVRDQLSGTAVALFPVERDRMVPSGTGAGSQIDRYGGGNFRNPIYGTQVAGAKDKLGDTPIMKGSGQHGWAYKDAAGKQQHQIAQLVDRPTLPGRGNDSGQTFETAALAVAGVQSGTYMGSVSWGWSVDGSGAYKQHPLTLVSKGKPSAGFIAAAKQWNTTSVGGTVETTADPTNVFDAAYSVAFTVAKGTHVLVSRAAPIHANETYDEVTINSGKEKGKTGRIKVNDMKQTGGTAVIKLPIP